MNLPTNNRIRAEYIIPSHYIDRDAYAANIPAEMIVERMNRELMSRLTDEILKHKYDAIETIRYDCPFRTEVKQRIELYVFTREELEEYTKRLGVKIATNIRDVDILINK
jgi:hypothetical protein